MNPKKTFSLLLVLAGEALIVFCFLHFGAYMKTDVLALNIIVSSWLYLLAFADIVLPWANFKDRAQKTIGSIGIRWIFTGVYFVVAIGLMLFFNLENPVSFYSQLIFHLIAIFLLALGLFLAFSSSDKVQEIYLEEQQNRAGLDELKNTAQNLLIKLDTAENIPYEISERIRAIQENIRFISPSNNSQAFGLEKQLLDSLNSISQNLGENPINAEKTTNNIKSCESIYKQRKLVYSN